ncbi:MAG: 1-deoxy-D-xylulose-5-phosphate reductoisomerase [Lysobacterales bacterium]
MKSICLLGATGSIGRSTLDLIARHPDRFRLHSAVAARDDLGMAEICERFRPEVAVMADADACLRLAARLRNSAPGTTVASGMSAIETVVADAAVDTVVAAIVGAAGLPATLAAAHAGKRILLANKEALVCAGGLLMQAVAQGGAQLLPIDSEHNAIFQCLPDPLQRPLAGVRQLWLTASGGPFRGWSRAQLEQVTVAQACAHPNWTMGPKISVDSATLMNKGLEVIEAHFLFGLESSRIRVIVHPQSTIHSLVEYHDGSFLAQLGSADMRIPIAHALAWPERIESGAPTLDLAALARLDFSTPDLEAFPCLKLAYQALEAGGTAPAMLNAANEVAVAAFLNGSLGFAGIAATVNEALNRCALSSVESVADVLEADRQARSVATTVIDSGKRS